MEYIFILMLLFWWFFVWGHIKIALSISVVNSAAKGTSGIRCGWTRQEGMVKASIGTVRNLSSGF